MIGFKEFLTEASNKELAKQILNVEDPIILNKIEGILMSDKIGDKLDNILNGRQFPGRSVDSIRNFFEMHSSNSVEKLALLQGLEEGMIDSLPAGVHNIPGLISSKYKEVSKLGLFNDFCEMAGKLTDSKESQGSTGTGAGEILLSLLIKDGFLPSSKGDINVFGKGMEVKSSSGRVAAFSSIDQADINTLTLKHFDHANDDLTDLKKLIKFLNKKDEKAAKEFLLDFFSGRASDKSYIPVLKSNINKLKIKTLTPKELQTKLGVSFVKLYQKTEGWSGIVLFKESKNYTKTNITVAYNEKDFEKLISFSGLGMTNGNQPVYLVAKSK
jgi:hypothetical protein